MLQSLTILVLVAVVHFVTAFELNRCPRPESLLPCVCAHAIVHCRDVNMTSQQLRNALREASGLAGSVKIRWQHLGKMHFSDFGLFGAKKIEIADSTLEGFAESYNATLMPHGLGSNLEELRILNSINDTNGDVQLQLWKLSKLKTLYLVDNVIKHVRKDWFENGVASLTELRLHKNGIETIEAGAFASLTQLTTLTIDVNELKVLNSNILPVPPTHLIKLDFNLNKIEKISEDFYDDMVSLSEIHLMSNRLKHLPKSTWRDIWGQVNNVDLWNNPLDCGSEIEWMFSMRRPILRGRCETPKERRSKKLSSLIDSRGLGK